MKYDYAFISDVHLGARDSKAEELIQFLKSTKINHLYLVGDIIDGWKLKRRWFLPPKHVNVLRKILKISKNGTKVTYITGNHDDFLRSFTGDQFNVGDIEIVDRSEVEIGSKKYIVIHGDQFDFAMQFAWLAHFGDWLYTVLLSLNSVFHWTRKKLGFKPWSLSVYLKGKVKSVTSFIGKFEDVATKFAKEEGYDGIICGHIHTPSIKTIEGIEYLNSGDWVENCSVLLVKNDNLMLERFQNPDI